MSHASFNCPYCWSDVPVQASVCSHCTRDLVLFKPLALRVQTLADEIEQLKVLTQQQAQALAQLQSQDIQTVAQSYAQTHDTLQKQSSLAPMATPDQSWLMLCSTVLLTVSSIGLCHWMLLFVYDAAPLFLRMLTITLPALTGYLCARRSGLGWLVHLMTATVVAALSVGLMLAITARIDAVPLWPDNPRDWRETLEYTAAIGLAFFTGYLVHRLIIRWQQQQRNKISLRILLARDEKGQFKITEISNQVQSLITATAPLVSASVALYSGLKAFTGN
ncbi:hypothetical protein [Limnohabitans sp. T6-20]|uniref:hypothetical protein n=1 Tax=Limnohabitans sp. T6-20 TaxID=1100725 RepID=UPI000D34859F|nr:hypothetical protein [Limnohabitans sp. T6-20]PUE12604.1 hypothetical protein B9Z33_03585 [Limnohabitans sp. T6-20]